MAINQDPSKKTESRVNLETIEEIETKEDLGTIVEIEKKMAPEKSRELQSHHLHLKQLTRKEEL